MEKLNCMWITEDLNIQGLLRRNRLKVYEIAEQVGYNNVDYFHKI